MRRKIHKYIYFAALLPIWLYSVFLPSNARCESIRNDNLLSTKNIYLWLESLQLPNGLLESTSGSNFVSLYENALAAIVFASQRDFEKAEKIFEFFDRIANVEMERGPGGFAQFRDKNGAPLDGKPHRWLGDNAWLLIAVHNYHNLAKNNKYESLAQKLEEWIRSLQKKDGGLIGGYDAEGKEIWKSTEGMIDSFNAVSGYDDFHKRLLAHLEKNYWDSEEKIFLAWVEHDQYRYAMDLHPWGFCAIPEAPEEMLHNAERYILTKTATRNHKQITGFCFDTDLDTIWLEGTGEIIVAYKSAGLIELAQKYLNEMEKMIFLVSKEKGLASIPYASNPGTHYAENLLWAGVDTNPSIASSVWYLLGKWSYDPMKIGRKKKIPAEDIFWIKQKKTSNHTLTPTTIRD